MKYPCGNGGEKTPNRKGDAMSTPRTRRTDEQELALVESTAEPDDRLTIAILGDQDFEQDDPLVTPWRRGHSAAVRELLSH